MGGDAVHERLAGELLTVHGHGELVVRLDAGLAAAVPVGAVERGGDLVDGVRAGAVGPADGDPGGAGSGAGAHGELGSGEGRLQAAAELGGHVPGLDVPGHAEVSLTGENVISVRGRLPPPTNETTI
ncbi:hypothetical protein GCM10010282_37810 [Streptomyces roseolus]|nr:hypothetical protein GCM10010282_37810 [Streptomyces roseolus]